MGQHSLSTSLVGYILELKNGESHKIGVASGEKLENGLLSNELPKFIRVATEDYGLMIISVSMIAALKRDISTHLKPEDYV